MTSRSKSKKECPVCNGLADACTACGDTGCDDTRAEDVDRQSALYCAIVQGIFSTANLYAHKIEEVVDMADLTWLECARRDQADSEAQHREAQAVVDQL